MPRTILLADDSITIRKVVELTFSDTDIRVESVASGHEALERLRDLRPDLVLADVVMPGPSGYEVCRAVKASAWPVPVLLLTGTFEPFDADQARACGSDGYVTKPFDSRSLVERVEALLSRRAPSAVSTAAEEDELEEMFDDLASPEVPGMIDAPPAPAGHLTLAEPDRVYEAVTGVPDGPTTATPNVGDAGAGTAEPPPEDASVVPVRIGSSAPDASEAPLVSGANALSPADIDAIARAVVARLSDRVLREIAWDVIPDLAEIVLRERIRELERDDRESS